MSFAHISDPHLSDLAGVRPTQLLSKRLLGYLSWRRRRRQDHSAEVLDALRRDLAQTASGLLLVTGDLTHLGLPDEFRQARQWLDSLDCEAIKVVPGNHDSYVAESWSATYHQWTPYLASDTCPLPCSLQEAFPALTVRDGVAFIGLSTAEPTPPLFATGCLGKSQLNRLAEMLTQCARRGLFRVIYLHHPPLPGLEKWRKRLRDSAELAEIIESCGAELLLHGHSHRSLVREWVGAGRNIPVIGVASASALGQHSDIACYNCFSVRAAEGDWLLDVRSRYYSKVEQCFLSGEVKTLRIPR